MIQSLFSVLITILPYFVMREHCYNAKFSTIVCEIACGTTTFIIELDEGCLFPLDYKNYKGA